MPLTAEQRRLMKIYIRANTYYTDGSYVVHTIEKAMDSTDSISTSDLFMPNEIIKTKDKNEFWFRMASIFCSDKVNDWHEMEYGSPLNVNDKRSRYVYSWSFEGNEYRFYTKILRCGQYSELVWYISSHKNIDDSSDEELTDSDEIMLQG